MPVAHQQLIRQKPPVQINLQGLHLRQSLQLVQIMLHASFGTLFYLREFLPLSCFGDRDLRFLRDSPSLTPEQDQPLNDSVQFDSYDAFLHGYEPSNHDPSLNKSAARRGQPLKIILRGKHDKADKILDLLENGIFNALSRNLLDAVQITILADKKNPSNVLETYTFSFSYNDPRLSGDAADDDMNSRLAGINLNANGTLTKIPTSKTSARNGIEMIIRRLITLSTFLPRLPNDRFMEIHLFHKDCCPPDYFPPGFQPVSDERQNDSLCYPEDDEWSTETQTCGTVNTGPHAVGLKVTSMKYRGTNQAGSDGGIDIPSTLSYSKRVAREEEIGAVVQAPASPAIASRQMSSNGLSCQEAKSAKPSAPVMNSQLSTQTRQDEITKHLLEKMVLPSTPASDIVPTQVKAHDLQTMIADDEEDTQVLRPQISQADMPKLRKIEAETQSKSAIGQLNNDVACQCGWKGTDPNEKMLRCSFCGRQQHPVCYGFLHSEDASIPAVHSCYQCLLDPGKEMHILRELSTLAMLRQALKVIVEKGFPNRTSDFAALLHCNGHTVVQITDILRKQGFLVATPGSRRKGFPSTGLPKYRIPFSAKMRERLRREIFNPLLKIKSHYIIPDCSQTPSCAMDSHQRHPDHDMDVDRGACSSIAARRTTQPTTELLRNNSKRLNPQEHVGVATPLRGTTSDASYSAKRRKLSCLRSPISIGGIPSDEIDDDGMSTL